MSTETLERPAARPAVPAMGVAPDAPPPWLRAAVRQQLAQTQAYATLPPEQRRDLAQAMVKVSHLVALSLQEEQEAEQAIRRRQAPPQRAAVQSLDAQPDFGTATRQIGQTTRDTLNAISFPRFVTDLLNGVFRAMNDSNQTQLQQYLQLLNAVSGSAQGFEQLATHETQARQWLVDHFPDQLEMDAPEAPDPEDRPAPGETPEPDDAPEVPRLRLRPNAHMPEADTLRAAFGLGPNEAVEAANPEALVPFARRQLARQRQQMLATMVMMGMNRIVIDAGKISAAMRFHIDTRSAASQDRGSQFGMQNRVKAGGSFGIGAWGASAEVENTISYVNTERSQRTEEINTEAELNSSVELHFHTDAVPLNRLAAQAQADRIRNASINPSAELETAHLNARQQRREGQRSGDEARRTSMNSGVGGVSQPSMRDAPLPVPAPGSTGGTGGASGGGGESGGTTGASGASGATGASGAAGGSGGAVTPP